MTPDHGKSGWRDAYPAATVHAAEVNDRRARTHALPHVNSVVSASRKTGSPVQTSDLVRIVAELTADIERFDSVISSQRQLLEKPLPDLAPGSDAQLREESDRISTSAAAILERARRALAELRSLSERPADT
jgi:hypothetical protein